MNMLPEPGEAGFRRKAGSNAIFLLRRSYPTSGGMDNRAGSGGDAKPAGWNAEGLNADVFRSRTY